VRGEGSALQCTCARLLLSCVSSRLSSAAHGADDKKSLLLVRSVAGSLIRSFRFVSSVTWFVRFVSFRSRSLVRACAHPPSPLGGAYLVEKRRVIHECERERHDAVAHDLTLCVHQRALEHDFLELALVVLICGAATAGSCRV
jgi:hypothetical protein